MTYGPYPSRTTRGRRQNEKVNGGDATQNSFRAEMKSAIEDIHTDVPIPEKGEAPSQGAINAEEVCVEFEVDRLTGYSHRAG